MIYCPPNLKIAKIRCYISPVVLRNGRRVLIDEEKFFQWLKDCQGGQI
jgi:hypothetical protein